MYPCSISRLIRRPQSTIEALVTPSRLVPLQREHPALGKHSTAKRHNWCCCACCDGLERGCACAAVAPVCHQPSYEECCYQASKEIRSSRSALRSAMPLLLKDVADWSVSCSDGSIIRTKAKMPQRFKLVPSIRDRASNIGCPARAVWPYKLPRISRTPRPSFRRRSARRVTPSA